MHRLQELFHTLAHPDAARKRDMILKTMAIVEVALTTTPDISRARAEHTLHRLTADILVAKRAGGMH